MSEQKFVHLHVHSHYSLLDGLGKIDDIVHKAVDQGAPAVALTDHGVMYGAIEFYNSCKKAGINPIVGVEAYVAPRSHTDKSAGVDTKPYHLLLLAKNFTGYKNLMKLTSIAHLEGYYYKPRIDRDLLSRYHEGIIASSACLASETSRLILDQNFEGLEQTIATYHEIFGKDNYYLELQDHPSIAEQQVVNQRVIATAQKMGLPLIATNDAHYINPTDHITHDQLICIQTGRLVSDTNRMVYTGDFSLKPAEEILAAFPDHPEALDNTLKIADMVNLEIPLGGDLLPQFPLPANETEESLLRKLCEEGLHKRYSQVTPEIRQRLEYELETVFRMGFPGYFLIVADFVNYAKGQGIMVGPGRGSAAGSLMAYASGITNVDPLKYDLLFERFLDPSRISMPDIDLDFEDTRRKEVIDYVRRKYGDEYVAGIITFGTIMARAAVRDVGRVLGMGYAQVDVIAKAVPAPIQGRHIPLEKSVKEAPELKEIYQQDPEAKNLLDSAMKLEGTIRQAGQHACAIVISRDPLSEYTPVQQSQGGDVHQVTQYSMGPIEKIGLLKMDFLGLSNLTIIRQAREIIEAVYGKEIDVYNVPLDDKKTFELFGRGETIGVFQFESAGMQRYLKELRPTVFEDLVAMNALYRPGPMQWIQSFVDRKNGKEKIEYMHPLAIPALEQTYGIPVYQEQVMRISKDMCGFTGSQADTLRKAIGKKIPKLMAEMKEKFIEGGVKNGVKESKAQEIWNQFEDFAAYCFNKSHAVCYAFVAFQTAYLKANYPDCFMAALMTSDLDDIDRLTIEITECERIGLKVLNPDVNESFPDFAVVKDKNEIRFGLAAIKNVGVNVAKSIVQERKKNGSFESLEDFLTRCAPFLNKKVLESLVKSGALDSFATRQSLYAGLELIAKFVLNNGHHNADQMDIFGGDSTKSALSRLTLPPGIEDKTEFLSWEKELLGLYLSDHPLKQYSELISQVGSPINSVSLQDAGKPVRVGGVVVAVKKIITKASNQTMAFIQLEDATGTIEAVVFPSVYQEQQALWIQDKLLLIEGKVSDKDGSAKVLVDKVWPLEHVTPSNLPKINSIRPMSRNSNHSAETNNNPTTTNNYRSGSNYTNANSTNKQVKPFLIELPKGANRQTIESLKKTLASFPGKQPVELRLLHNGSTQVIQTPITVKVGDELEERIASILR